MKHTYFIKFDPRIKRLTGCDRATLILEKIEFFFSKQPNGFYKFIEPCSHRLYKKFDSWSEELGCDRKCFTRSWEKIAFRHKSRSAFNEAKDKFEGKLYASFYDRNRNQMFFIRNHELANETLKEFYKPKKSTLKKDNTQSKKTTDSLASKPLRNGHSGRSYKDVKRTPPELFENNSHAGNEIIKKMIEIWTVIVQEGRGEIELKGKIIPFLKKALTDKFNNCLKKWKDYCISIASSKYLMGEKVSWKADIDWALKFESIRKVLSGNYYGIGDRTPKAALAGHADLQGEILASVELQEIKDFRTLCLETVGNAKYISYFKNLNIEFREEGGIALISPHKFAADDLERNCYSYLRLILQGLAESLKTITILAPGETIGRIVERERGGGGTTPSVPQVSVLGDATPGEPCMQATVSEDGMLPENEEKRNNFSAGLMVAPTLPTLLGPTEIAEAVIEKSSIGVPDFEDEEPWGGVQATPETQMLRKKLRQVLPPNQFPSWLSTFEVEGISQGGKIVVTLEDSFAVDWCRSRFSKEIFQSAKSIWSGLDSLVIREKVGDNISLSLENVPKKSEDAPEKSTLEQAIQSLLSACSPGNMSEALGIQGTCQAFD